jgi:hypothetical protein
MTARHGNHLIRLESIIIHANLAMLPFRRRASGAILPRSFGNLVFSAVGGGSGATSGLDAAFLLDLVGIVEEGLEETFFGPFVFAH